MPSASAPPGGASCASTERRQPCGRARTSTLMPNANRDARGDGELVQRDAVPRSAGGATSPWYTGTCVLSVPIASPPTKRPAIITPSPRASPWSSAPAQKTAAPTTIACFCPTARRFARPTRAGSTRGDRADRERAGDRARGPVAERPAAVDVRAEARHRLDARDVADVEPEEQAADRREQPDAHGRRPSQRSSACCSRTGSSSSRDSADLMFERAHRAPPGARPRQKRHVVLMQNGLSGEYPGRLDSETTPGARPSAPRARCDATRAPLRAAEPHRPQRDAALCLSVCLRARLPSPTQEPTVDPRRSGQAKCAQRDAQVQCAHAIVQTLLRNRWRFARAGGALRCDDAHSSPDRPRDLVHIARLILSGARCPPEGAEETSAELIATRTTRATRTTSAAKTWARLAPRRNPRRCPRRSTREAQASARDRTEPFNALPSRLVVRHPEQLHGQHVAGSPPRAARVRPARAASQQARRSFHGDVKALLNFTFPRKPERPGDALLIRSADLLPDRAPRLACTTARQAAATGGRSRRIGRESVFQPQICSRKKMR